MSFLRRGNGSRSGGEDRTIDSASLEFDRDESSPVDLLTHTEQPADDPEQLRDSVRAPQLGMTPEVITADGQRPDGAAPTGWTYEFEQLEVVPMWRQMVRVFTANRLAVLSTAVLILIVLFCYVGPFIYHTNQTNTGAILGVPENLAPGAHWKCTFLCEGGYIQGHTYTFPLGTGNTLAWDQLGRIMYGGEYSLSLGFLAGIITIVVGTTYGMVAGYFGGVLDALMMRILDAFLAIPYLYLIIALVAVFHNSTPFLIGVIGLTGWWGNARIIRGDALAIRDLEYSQAATSMGSSRWHIIWKHVFPNSISNIVTVGTFSIADAILFLSALGFLGLGIQPPQTDWGTMLNQGVQVLQSGYWWEVYPVAAVFIVVVVCINYIGDALRDVFEVRLRER